MTTSEVTFVPFGKKLPWAGMLAGPQHAVTPNHAAKHQKDLPRPSMGCFRPGAPTALAAAFSNFCCHLAINSGI
jgi:hypothetical protein